MATYEPGRAGWPAAVGDWYAELRPHYDRVKRFMDVVPVPPDQWNGRTRLMKEAADRMGAPQRFRPAEVAVRFGQTALDWRSAPRRFVPFARRL